MTCVDDVGGLHSRDTTHHGGTDDQGEEGVELGPTDEQHHGGDPGQRGQQQLGVAGVGELGRGISEGQGNRPGAGQGGGETHAR